MLIFPCDCIFLQLFYASITQPTKLSCVTDLPTCSAQVGDAGQVLNPKPTQKAFINISFLFWRYSNKKWLLQLIVN